MTTGIVIFSRLDSRRLPGKALTSFGGRPLLGHVINQVLGAKRADHVIVATSDREIDDPVAAFADAQNVSLFRGSVDDVLGRAYACAEGFGLDHLVRICGDSPFIDPKLIDRMIDIQLAEEPDITTNLFPRTFPAGMSVEVLSFETLARLAKATSNPAHREHVTAYIYENPDQFAIRNEFSGVVGYEGTPLTVDSAVDLVQANWIATMLHQSGADASLRSVVNLARQWRHMRPVGTTMPIEGLPAILGGTPTVHEELKPYPAMGEAEVKAAADVVRSGRLSGFFGSPGPEFGGGPKVRAFEKKWCERYRVPHAISVNSATSGLIAAMGAVGITPGDEVIVPPWTMSASVMAPLIYGGIPVFVDIEDETFCIDVDSVAEAITPKTKAIVAVDLFGHPARLVELRALADQHGIWLIEDSAQAPWAEDDGCIVGTVGHIGVFSLNCHKHIQTGEGGVCVTDDDDLAQRLRLIRNHGENCVADEGIADLTNLIGFNFRMSEVHAAVGIEQLARIDDHIKRREHLAHILSDGLKDLDGITVPAVRQRCRHNYYEWVAKFDAETVGVSREIFSLALATEGFPHFTGYVAPLYRLPAFQKRRAMGRDGFPFTLTNRTYEDGMCSVCERLHEHEALLFETCAFDIDDDKANRLVEAFRKVYAYRDNLKGIRRRV